MKTKCDGVIVHIHSNKDATQVSLSGDYYLNVSPDYVTLVDITSLKEVIRWPRPNILQFTAEKHSDRGSVTLEISQ